jgi:hypothetical protein
MPRQVTALAQWYGSDRTICPKIADLLKGCDWVGIPFAGGMSAIRAIRARTINANDLHRGIIALAEVVKHKSSCKTLQQALRQKLFHPDTLRQAQGYLNAEQPPSDTFKIAEAYFIVCWMTRSGAAGTDAERTASLSTRWDSGGGDSAKRYYSAIDSLETWCDEFQRCNFTCLDAFEFLAKCKDRQRHGLYIDPPFIGPGDKYTHQFGADQWRRLARELTMFLETRVVVRCYDIPLISKLFPNSHWQYLTANGRKQTNAVATEILIVNHPNSNGCATR